MKVCAECGEQFTDRVTFCAFCGQPVEAVAAVAEIASGKPNVFLKILAVPAMLIGAFLLVVVLITYYAGTVSAVLASGSSLIVGIAAATAGLLAVVGAIAFFVTRTRK